MLPRDALWTWVRLPPPPPETTRAREPAPAATRGLSLYWDKPSERAHRSVGPGDYNQTRAPRGARYPEGNIGPIVVTRSTICDRSVGGRVRARPVRQPVRCVNRVGARARKRCESVTGARFGHGEPLFPEGVSVEVVRSARRTISIQVTNSARVVVRVPRRVPDREIDRVLGERSAWVYAALARCAQREATAGPAPTAQEIETMRAAARLDISARIERWAPIVGARPTTVQIRNQRSRWGSCSTRGTITVNLQVMRLPEHIRDYIVVHELTHIIHHNHGPEFWAHVARCMPDYRARRASLREVVLFS